MTVLRDVVKSVTADTSLNEWWEGKNLAVQTEENIFGFFPAVLLINDSDTDEKISGIWCD